MLLAMERLDHDRRNGISRRTMLALLIARATIGHAARADEAVVRIFYLRSLARPPNISLLDHLPPDAGLAGATLALQDNNTTGALQGQRFALVDIPIRNDGDVTSAMVAQGARLVITDLPAEQIPTIAASGARMGATIFNIAATDDALRGEHCRPNLIHVVPSRAMMADAVAQYLVWKKWSRWLLVLGSHPDDKLLADAYRRAAKRFGARIVQERVSQDTGGSRQTDTGIVQVQQQIPVLTQGAPEYDVLVAADENEVFAGYLPFRTWDARPVVGSAGLEPVTWDASSESWGGAQLQSRFVRLFHRAMMPLDMQAWTAVRMIGEAASRSGSTEVETISATIHSGDFGVAAYKGQRLTLRAWDGQLRQPIFLADGRSVVSVSPQPGFLHEVTELDTLGVDQPETKCSMQ